MSKTPDLEPLFDRHEKAVLAFSGGKDSLVCLHLCRDYRDQLTVVWVNTGAMFPHMAEFIRKAAEGFNYVEIRSDVEAWRRKLGEPSDIVPTFNSLAGIGLDPLRSRLAIQPWTTCCLENRTLPIWRYAEASGATLSIHGQRKSDAVMSAFITRVHQGSPVELCPLIADWSDDDVFRYIAEHEIQLPAQYSTDPLALRSLECWSCTALLDESDRLNYTRVHHPELWARLRPRLLAVYQVMREAANGTAQVLGGVLGAEEEASVARELKADTAYALLDATGTDAAPRQVGGGLGSTTRP